MNICETPLYKATVSHYEAQRDEAMAILELYFTNSVAIGDHSGILEDIKEWTKKLSEAEESLETLQTNFEELPDEEVDEE